MLTITQPHAFRQREGPRTQEPGTTYKEPSASWGARGQETTLGSLLTEKAFDRFLKGAIYDNGNLTFAHPSWALVASAEDRLS